MNLDELLERVPGARRFRFLNAATLRILLDRQPGQCTWCGEPVPRGSRTWCSARCVREFELRCTAKVVSYVEQRDNWICQLCGRDTRASEKEYAALCGEWFSNNPEERRLLELKKASLGYGRYEWRAVDHILPVIRYGGLCGPTNLRLLCGQCHLVETNRLRKAALTTANQKG